SRSGLTWFHLVESASPCPTRPADLVYALFVLSHLPRPEGLLRRWMGEIGCGGVLALDEVEWIRTDNAAFRRYLKLVGALLSVRGSTIVTGPIIERFDGGPQGRRRP